MKTRAISIAAAAAMLAGCSVATTVRQNTMAINGSSATIGSNTAAIRESTMATTALVPALQGVNGLRAPLESVAALSPTLQGVASLREPMTRVAALDAPMSQLAALGTILNRPLLLVGIGALALAAWGLVTFVAVRFAILSASRAHPKSERPLTV